MHARTTQLWQWVMVLCLLPVLALAAPTPIPDLHDPVVDTVQVLSADEAQQLRTQALELQARRGAQLHKLLSGTGIFEQDLHKHIHLENNIVFPKAQAMEAKFDLI